MERSFKYSTAGIFKYHYSKVCKAVNKELVIKLLLNVENYHSIINTTFYCRIYLYNTPIYERLNSCIYKLIHYLCNVNEFHEEIY
jgi:hypothetical protein